MKWRGSFIPYLVRVLGTGILLLVSACMRPEKPWSLPPAEGLQTLQANLGPEYDTIAFVSLAQGLVHRVPRWSWDLEIRTRDGYYEVRTNAAMYAFVATLDSAVWAGSLRPNDLRGWRCELPDTMALAPLTHGESVFCIIDRDRAGLIYPSGQRYSKLRFSPSNEALIIEAYDLEGRPLGIWRANRGPEPLFLALNRPGAFVSVLPSWQPDLILTRYVHLFADQPEPFRYYPVVGALLWDKRRAGVVQSASLSFENFTYAQLPQVPLTTRRDVIGYDWKQYDFDTGTYLIDFSRYFVLEADIEVYYKLRFVDFYDASGRKGSAKLSFSRL